MPWKEVDTMSLRREFVGLAGQLDANVRELCRRFQISPKTAYKWIGRYLSDGPEGLRDRSRRPRRSPMRTPTEIEREVLAMRGEHPAWGGRKINARLLALGNASIPAPSTITDILRRHGRLDQDESLKHKPFVRFSHERPNELWQMDFKGHFPLREGRCHPLTVIDDHSRFALGVFACANERENTVRTHLMTLFRRYGLPRRMLVDNGSPWGSDPQHPYTPLTVWLLRLDVGVSHGRPYHPQTQGKCERFHRTLVVELLRDRSFEDIEETQVHFESWRHVYNHERPHEALDMATPAEWYRASPRCFPERLPAIEYAPGDIIRKVQDRGRISCRGRSYKLSRAFKGCPVALRATQTDGLLDVYFCHHKIAQLNLKDHNESP